MFSWTTRLYRLLHCKCLFRKRQNVCIEVDEATREIKRALPTGEYRLGCVICAVFTSSRVHLFHVQLKTSMTCDIASSAPRLDSNQLPPFIDTLRKICERANYQAAIWCWSLQSHIQIPSPAGHGWSLEEDRLVVNWMSGEPAPVDMLELLSCRCKRRCQLPNCTCLSNGLQCTDFCTLKDCDNEHESPVTAITEDDN